MKSALTSTTFPALINIPCRDSVKDGYINIYDYNQDLIDPNYNFDIEEDSVYDAVKSVTDILSRIDADFIVSKKGNCLLCEYYVKHELIAFYIYIYIVFK